ncbi:hypothetical protein Z946_2685 [Sulfitobacter noctilucicola]|nr:hypothetical protein Z946_2685 [Sulfitobacter noctilucicola]
MIGLVMVSAVGAAPNMAGSITSKSINTRPANAAYPQVAA